MLLLQSLNQQLDTLLTICGLYQIEQVLLHDALEVVQELSGTDTGGHTPKLVRLGRSLDHQHLLVRLEQDVCRCQHLVDVLELLRLRFADHSLVSLLDLAVK